MSKSKGGIAKAGGPPATGARRRNTAGANPTPLGYMAVGNNTTLSLTNVTLAANSVLVIVVGCNFTGARNTLSCTFNGAAMHQAALAAINSATVKAQCAIFYLTSLTGATGAITVNSTTGTLILMMQANQVTGLANPPFNPNAPTPMSSSSNIAQGQPSVGLSGTIPANAYIQGGFLLDPADATVMWGGPQNMTMTDGGQDVTAVTQATSFTLTEGFLFPATQINNGYDVVLTNPNPATLALCVAAWFTPTSSGPLSTRRGERR